MTADSRKKPRILRHVSGSHRIPAEVESRTGGKSLTTAHAARITGRMHKANSLKLVLLLVFDFVCFVCFVFSLLLLCFLTFPPHSLFLLLSPSISRTFCSSPPPIVFILSRREGVSTVPSMKNTKKINNFADKNK